MADPVSFLAAGVGIADVAFRVVKYLKDVNEARKTIDTEISALISEVENLVTLHNELEKKFLESVKRVGLADDEKMLWSRAEKTLENGQEIVRRLEDSVKEIYGDSRTVTGRWDGLKKQDRKRSKNGTLSELRSQIGTYHGVLQMWLLCISMHVNSEDREVQRSQFDELRGLIEGLSSKVQQMHDSPLPGATAVYNDYNLSLSVFNQISKSIDGIGNTVTINKHFDTPKPVDRFYTGRTEQAEQLKKWLLPGSFPGNGRAPIVTFAKQNRFVIYGIGGSGKTQFCCKFAEDNRDHFWGVFWVDGSSQQRLKQTFSENVSSIAGVEPNEKAALHWLSNLNESWLLIIDNADNPDLKLDDYFPRGNRGHVIITTRDPLNKSYGTVGDEFFDFEGLENDEAVALLLKAAGQPQPWDLDVTDMATTIAKTLGHLAIAIVQAGKTIRESYCKLDEYLEYYDRQWKKLRQREGATTRASADDLGVLTTFEINRQAIRIRCNEASEDALQLLDIFAFLYNQNIRFDILKRAVVNPRVENVHQDEEKRKEVETRPIRSILQWSSWWRETVFDMLALIYKDRSPSVLPSAIRAGQKAEEFDPDRLRAALRQLTRFSLVIYNEKTDSYSMHPLVHKWARERPDMSISEQGLWCGAAAIMLAHCILIPPLGNTTEDEEIQRLLLPHVDHVRECQTSIEDCMRKKRVTRSRIKLWPVLEPIFSREKALMYAKFSIVYAQNGRWEEAKKLQLEVKDITMQYLGLKHATTRRVTLALAGTMITLSEIDEAAALQEQVLTACIAHLGADHRETLVTKGTLGECRFLQGRTTDAKILHEEAVAGLTKLYGVDHKDTLNAIDHLGQAVLMFWTEDAIRRARDLHLQAVNAMRKVHGHDHLRTLIACENLCKTAVQSGDPDHLHDAHKMMIEVYETRKRKLGKEHAYTLLAMMHLAFVKRGLGHLKDAEELILLALPIAERNLGTNHVACLWGRYHLGIVWVQQKRWDEAERHLLDLTERQRSILQGRGRLHPDRLGALTELATVYDALGKFEEYDKVVAEVLDGFERISTSEHPVAKKLREDTKRRVEKREKTVQGANVVDG